MLDCLSSQSTRFFHKCEELHVLSFHSIIYLKWLCFGILYPLNFIHILTGWVTWGLQQDYDAKLLLLPGLSVFVSWASNQLRVSTICFGLAKINFIMLLSRLSERLTTQNHSISQLLEIRLRPAGFGRSQLFAEADLPQHNIPDSWTLS